MPTALRPMRAEDADAFAALVRSVFAAVDVQPPPSARRVTGEDVRALLAHGGGATTAPDEAGVLWAEVRGGLYVSRLAVRADLRRTGLAARLLEAAVAEARRRGLPRAWLSSRSELLANHRLFARCGFRETGRHPHPLLPSSTTVDFEHVVAGDA